MASNFIFMSQFLKDLSAFLDEANLSNGSVQEVGLSFDTERELLITEAVFYIDINPDEKECMVGKSVIKEVYLSQYSDSELIKHVVGEILLDIENQLLDNADSYQSPIRIH